VQPLSCAGADVVLDATAAWNQDGDATFLRDLDVSKLLLTPSFQFFKKIGVFIKVFLLIKMCINLRICLVNLGMGRG